MKLGCSDVHHLSRQKLSQHMSEQTVFAINLLSDSSHAQHMIPTAMRKVESSNLEPSTPHS